MARYELRFGVPVTDEEREYGSLEGVALAKETLSWDALTIRRGLLRQSEALIAQPAVVDANDTRVLIAIPPAAGTPTPATRILRAGMRVRTREGGATIGRLALVLATDDGDLLHLVVQRRPLGPYQMIQATTLVAMEPDVLTVALAANELAALPPYRSDADLAFDVRQRIASHKPFIFEEHRYIRVLVVDGMATLTGHISSRLRADQIENALARIPGLLGIEDQLVCDDELAIEVAGALAAVPRTRPHAFRVESDYGVVTLSGKAPDAATAIAATEITAEIPSVRGTVNQIRAPGFVPDDGWIEAPAIGESVYAEDFPVGSVEQIVINPRKRRLSGIVVAARVPEDDSADPRWLERTVFLPVERFRTVTEAGVFINGRAPDAARGPLAAEHTTLASPSWRPPFPYRLRDVAWPRETAEPVSLPRAPNSRAMAGIDS